VKAKILIVGGGVMGTSIAMRAARQCDPLTEPVVLLEKADLASGSSGRSGAILRQNYAERTVASMARDSLREYTSFEARTGRRIGFRRTGVLSLKRESGAIERLTAKIEMQKSIGINTQLVTATELRELVSGIDIPDDMVGAWEPDGGFVDPVRTVHQFAALARTYGSVTRLGVEAQRLIVESGRVVGVETSEGRYDAEQVVLVAGPWTAGLLAQVDVSIPMRVLRPEQHFISMPSSLGVIDPESLGETRMYGADLTDPLERASEEVNPNESSLDSSAHPVILDWEYGFYVRCEPDSRLARIGRLTTDRDRVLENPDDLDEAVDPEMKNWAREVLSKRMPVYEGAPGADSLAGWYTMTPDSQPVIGPIPQVSGLFVVSGFSGHGFKLAPSVSEGVAQMLREEPVSAFEPEFFSPTRFDGSDVEWAPTFGF